MRRPTRLQPSQANPAPKPARPAIGDKIEAAGTPPRIGYTPIIAKPAAPRPEGNVKVKPK